MHRTTLNPPEAALLTWLIPLPAVERTPLLDGLEPLARLAILDALRALDALTEHARHDANHAWRRDDARHAKPIHTLRSLPEDAIARASQRLEPRWAYAMLAIRQLPDDDDHDETPHHKTSPLHTLAATLLLERASLMLPLRDDLLHPDPHRFDLASLLTWQPIELDSLAYRLGLLAIAASLRQHDRRELARQLQRFSPHDRQLLLDDLRRPLPIDDALTRRINEVIIVLARRYDSHERLLPALGLYTLTTAIGRRRPQLIDALAMRLSPHMAIDLQRFARQHRTSSRRGLEPLATQLIESLLDLLVQPSDQATP